MRQILPVAVIALTGLCSVAAVEGPRSEIGTLTCAVGGADAPPAGETAAGAPGTGAQARELICAFRAQRGATEETYTGVVQGVGEHRELFANGVLMWAVRSAAGTPIAPGMLQQSYAADTTAAPGQGVPLIGETNRAIVLVSMAEKEGAAADKAAGVPPTAMILSVALTLKAALS